VAPPGPNVPKIAGRTGNTPITFSLWTMATIRSFRAGGYKRPRNTFSAGMTPVPPGARPEGFRRWKDRPSFFTPGHDNPPSIFADGAGRQRPLAATRAIRVPVPQFFLGAPTCFLARMATNELLRRPSTIFFSGPCYLHGWVDLLHACRISGQGKSTHRPLTNSAKMYAFQAQSGFSK